MTKKRMLLGMLLLLLAAAGDLCIWFHPASADSARLTVEVPVLSETEDDLTLYWLTGGQDPDTGFTAVQARGVHYTASQEIQLLRVEIPADITGLRVDPIAAEAEISIGQPRLLVRGTPCGDPLDFDAVYRIHGIASMTGAFTAEPAQEATQSQEDDVAQGTEISQTNGTEQNTQPAQDAVGAEDGGSVRMITITPDGDDPYLVWQVDADVVAAAAAAVYRPMNIALKLAAMLALTGLLLLIWVKWAPLSEIPREILSSRKLIASLAKNDFRTKFAGSLLGIVWAFVQPIVTVVIYWFVFQKALNVGTASTKAGITVPYVLWLVAGLVPWFYFQELMISGTNVLIEYNYLVKKVVFNISILPVVKAVSALFVHLFFVAFTLVLYACYGHFPDLYMLQILYYSFAMMVLALGIIYLTSAVVVFFRDLSQIVNIITQVLVWATPIMWNIDGMTNIPRAVEIILKLNPMYYIVSGYRESLINQTLIWERPGLTLWFWLVTAGIFIAGTMVFRKLRVHFADVL